MKSSESSSRLHWPREGAARRVPRRLATQGVGAATTCEVISFSGTHAEPARAVAWDALATALPRGTRVVLLVAAEDVSFTTADVPPLSGMRLREALPNLVEEKTVGDVGALHVALGQDAEGSGSRRVLAVIDRHWLAAMQVDVVRAGHRVAAIIPESLAVPLADGAWSLAAVAATTNASAHRGAHGGGPTGTSGGTGARLFLRNAAQQAIPLPDEPASAIATVTALVRQATGAARAQRLDLYATPAAQAAAKALGESIATSLAVPISEAGGDPFIAWLGGRGHEGAYGAPMSLLAFDSGQDGRAEWARWRIAAALVLAILAVQVIGMQWRWAGLKREASALRDEQTKALMTAFPDTRVVLDASLQMSRGLASLRASSGRSDPADFSMMMAASARIFAALPSNAMRAADYDARALKLRFAPGMASASDERERLIAQATQEGYVLRFESAPNAASEAVASLKTKGGA